MKKLLFIMVALCSMVNIIPDGNLFDNLVFHENRTRLMNVSAVFQSFGKNPYDMSLFSKGEDTVRSHTALDFIYNDITYYLPIDNNVECCFLDTCKKGDTMYLDIIVFDSINTNATQRTGVNVFYSYIVAIRR